MNRTESLIKPILPEVPWDLPNTERLLNIMATVIWSNDVVKQYGALPKQTGPERKTAKSLVAKTAEQLLENPQDIRIAEGVWRTSEAEEDSYASQEPFSELVRKDCLTLVKDKWKGVKPEQLAGLVRIYPNKDESQKSARESAEHLLRNYFRGPDSRNERTEAEYNFLLGILDLKEEEEAFKEGMKIALHATDILPKKPYLIDQSMLVSLPDKEDESLVFRQALVLNYVISQLRFMGLQNFEEYYKDRRNFVRIEAKEEIRNRQKRIEKKIGGSEVKRLNDKMLDFFRTITAEVLTEDKKQSLKGEWPYKVAFDENDPLNQKFNRILADQTARSSQLTS